MKGRTVMDNDGAARTWPHSLIGQWRTGHLGREIRTIMGALVLLVCVQWLSLAIEEPRYYSDHVKAIALHAFLWDACIRYSAAHGGEFPAALEELPKQGYVPANPPFDFESKWFGYRNQEGTWVQIRYLHPNSQTATSKTVVFYDDPPNTQGRVVVTFFRDTVLCRVVTQTELEAILKGAE